MRSRRLRMGELPSLRRLARAMSFAEEKRSRSTIRSISETMGSSIESWPVDSETDRTRLRKIPANAISTITKTITPNHRICKPIRPNPYRMGNTTTASAKKGASEAPHDGKANGDDATHDLKVSGLQFDTSRVPVEVSASRKSWRTRSAETAACRARISSLLADFFIQFARVSRPACVRAEQST